MYKAALFDMDGLIFDTEVIYKRCWQEAALKQGLHIDDLFYSHFIGVKDNECEQMLNEYFINDSFNLEQFRCDRDHLCHQAEQQKVALKSGFDALFNHLLQKNIKLALVTSSITAQVMNHFSHYPYLQHFDIIITGEEVSQGKPNPECYTKAVAAFNLQAKQCAVFEDSNNGMLAGLAAGCACFMVPDMAPPIPEVKEKAAAVLSSLEQAIKFFNQ